MNSLATLGVEIEKIGDIARILRSLSGFYDEAARATASL